MVLYHKRKYTKRNNKSIKKAGNPPTTPSGGTIKRHNKNKNKSRKYYGGFAYLSKKSPGLIQGQVYERMISH